jgi:hypothetical protein
MVESPVLFPRRGLFGETSAGFRKAQPLVTESSFYASDMHDRILLRAQAVVAFAGSGVTGRLPGMPSLAIL